MSLYLRLRPYQTAIARAVLDSVLRRRGQIFTVEMASQSGARELSVQLELLLLALHAGSGARMVKVASTPAESGEERLAAYLAKGRMNGFWESEAGVVRLGRAAQHSVDPSEIGALRGPISLLEVANAQDLELHGRHRHVLPLAEDSGATVVLYGSPWNGESWFELLKQQNRELSRVDCRQRHFRVPWREAAGFNPLYGQYVDQQLANLGQGHPWFQTRYELRPVPSSGPLFSEAQMRGLGGSYPRGRSPKPGAEYVASVQVTRTLRQHELSAAPPTPGGDGVTVLATIAEASGPWPRGSLGVVDHRWWTSSGMAEVLRPLADLLGKRWGCRRVVAQSAEDQLLLTRQLRQHLPHATVEGYAGGMVEESAMGMALLAQANTGRLKCYMPDGSPEHRALRRELGSARALAQPGGLVAVESQRPENGFLRGLLLLQQVSLPPASREPALLVPVGA